MSLSINIRSASSEATDSQVSRAITQLAVFAKRQRASLPDGPALDITFMLPGKLDKPGFNGMRMGGYTDREQVLYFEAAVPEELVHSPQANRYVELAVQDVIANANDFFVQNYRAFDRVSWEKALDHLAIP